MNAEPKKRPRIILAGGSGFLGTILTRHFAVAGWDVIVLTRSPSGGRGGQISWDGETLGPWQESLEAADALVNLSGRSINCRHTEGNRQDILESRIRSTRILGEAIARCGTPPKVWLNCSGADIYPESFDHDLDETNEPFAGACESSASSKRSTDSLVRERFDSRDPGANKAVRAPFSGPSSFSHEVACLWERAFEEASIVAIRKVALRISMVLGAAPGTAFPILRRLAKAGLAGRMGNGQQYVSWIHEADFCRAVDWLIQKPNLKGPINVTAPNPITNEQFMRRLRQAAGRSFGLPASRWMLELGAFVMKTETELMLNSRRVAPGRLLASGFKFHFPELGTAFAEMETRLTGNAKTSRKEAEQ